MDSMNILYDQDYIWNAALKESRNEGLERGRLEGEANGIRKIAARMADMGFSAEEIADVVDEEVKTVQTWLNR